MNETYDKKVDWAQNHFFSIIPPFWFDILKMILYFNQLNENTINKILNKI